MRSFVVCIFQKSYYHDERKECEVGETCNTQGEMKNEYKIVVGIFGYKTCWGKMKVDG
jgi:hypothetical protein